MENQRYVMDNFPWLKILLIIAKEKIAGLFIGINQLI
jgi:hypothetical protein